MSDHVREQLELARGGELSLVDRTGIDAHLATCNACRSYAAELARNDELLSRREPPVALPPYAPRSHDFQWVTAAAVVLAALVIVTAIGVAREQAARPSATPPASGAPTPTATRSASVGTSPSPTPTPTPSFVGEPEALTGVTTHALGALQGDWIFAAVDRAGASSRVTDVWAVPLAGGAPQLALTFPKSRGGIPEALIESRPSLRRGFSPDGKRIVVSTAKQLVIVDLPSGQARGLGIDGAFPAWSRTGDLIAFLRDEPNPDPQNATPLRSVWVVSAAGGPANRLVPATFPLEWSNDTRLLAGGEGGYVLIDTATGTITARIPSQGAGGGTNPLFWRRGSSDLAAIFHVADRDELTVVDMSSGTRRVVASTSGAASLDDPRWSPTVADQLLYIEIRGTGASIERRVHVVDASGRDSSLPLAASEATWTPDGSGIAYIEVGTSTPNGRAVRLFDRGTGRTRDLLTVDGATENILDVASVSY